MVPGNIHTPLYTEGFKIPQEWEIFKAKKLNTSCTYIHHVHVVVQFYPWFKSYFPFFQTHSERHHYITIPKNAFEKDEI